DAARQAAQPLLLATKLAPPRVGAALIVRERLLLQLDGVLAHRLTLLSAAAGWGKTTLLASWLQSVERRAQSVEPVCDALALRSTFYAPRWAWLSLDALDNEQTRFWAAMIAALRTCLPDVGDLALAMLHAPEPPLLSAILTALLND